MWSLKLVGATGCSSDGFQCCCAGIDNIVVGLAAENNREVQNCPMYPEHLYSNEMRLVQIWKHPLDGILNNYLIPLKKKHFKEGDLHNTEKNGR